MQLTQRDRLENQHLQRSLHQVDLLGHSGSLLGYLGENAVRSPRLSRDEMVLGCFSSNSHRIAEVLRLRATSAVSPDGSVRALRSGWRFVGELTERGFLCGSRGALQVPRLPRISCQTP